jgi:hypothetical protein
MKTLLVTLVIVFWTLSCGAAWLLLDPTIAFLQANADVLGAWPELLYWTRWLLELIAKSGFVLIALVWVGGLIGIIAASWLLTALWRRFNPAVGAATGSSAAPSPGSPPATDPPRTAW